MKLQAFRVKNFKSIVDTKWCNLSFDNITGLIGQNESGKSSILEALYSFYSGVLDTDALRPDDTMPEVSCSFVLTEGEFDTVFANIKIPEAVKEIVRQKNWRINISTLWPDAKTAKRIVEEKELLDLIVSESKKTTSNEPAVGVGEPTPNTNLFSEEVFIKALVDKLPKFQIFQDHNSLLPNTIDVLDIENKNTSAEGYNGVMNFLTIAQIDLNYLKTKPSGNVKKKINDHNTQITADFQEFWSQTIGKSNKIKVSFELKNYGEGHEKQGKSYFEFWVDDGRDTLHPKQRSLGVRWFLSFYLQLKASKINSGENNTVLLIDEPGESLHARAQADVLKVFDDIKDKLQIIYTTHSPYLVKIDWLYRLIAVQRANERDDSSETLVFDAHKLGAANQDTLTPLLTNMGVDLHSHTLIKKDNNIILEEPSAFYYLKAFSILFNKGFNPNYIPATGANKIQPLVHMFLGWGIDYVVVLDNDKKGEKVYNTLKQELFCDDDTIAKKKVMFIPEGCPGIEDLFSNSDFKKHVIEKPDSTFESKNSEYMKNGNFSKPIHAAKFKLKVDNSEITLADFDEETKRKITELLDGMEILTNPEQTTIEEIAGTQILTAQTNHQEVA